VVSSESVSMISEAISSGKPVVVFKLKKKKKNNSKFEKMFEHLKNEGYITLTEAEDLSDTICRELKRGVERKVPRDRENIYKELYRLL